MQLRLTCLLYTSEIRLEKGISAELEKTTQIIKRTGLFDTVDRIYGEPGAEYMDDQAQQGGPDGGMGGGPMSGGGDFGGGLDALGSPGEDEIGDIGGEEEMCIRDRNNAARINESKPQVMFTEDDKTCGVCGSKECKCEDPAKSADIEGYENLKDANPKKSFRQSKHSTGKAKEANDYKPVKESAEVLGWHQTGQDAKGNIADTYMDKTHGTEVGDSAPFDEEPVEEGTSMHSEGENQNNPTVGSNKICLLYTSRCV